MADVVDSKRNFVAIEERIKSSGVERQDAFLVFSRRVFCFGRHFLAVPKMPLYLLLGLAWWGAAYKHDHLFPGSTPLVFDHTIPALESIEVAQLNCPYVQEYYTVEVEWFRRIPVHISLPKQEVEKHDTLNVLAKLEFLDQTAELPILLLYKKGFGGNHAIWYDTSNFCDWVDRHGTHLAPPVSTELAMNVKYPAKTAYWASKVSENYFLYVGFSGKTPVRRQVSFKIEFAINTFQVAQSSSHPCHVLEGSIAPHLIHTKKRSNASAFPSMVAKEIVVRQWTQLEGSEEPSNPKLKAVFQYSPDSMILLGVDFPELPKKTEDFEPMLIFRGIRPSDSSLLVGNYGSKSIWEFQKMLFNFDDREGRSVALPLRNILGHLARHKSVLDPPGNTILIAIIPAKAGASNNFTRSSNETLTVYPVVLSLPRIKTEFESQVLDVTSDVSGRKVVANYAVVYSHFVRGLIFMLIGTSAMFGILRGCCLVVAKLSSIEQTPQYMPAWLSKTPEPREVGDLEVFYQRRSPGHEGDAGQDDRTKLLGAHSVQFDIASAGGDSHR
eukprot:Gregarina_sp_Poly_1__9177@NODE_564_length_7515_cov_115_964823_g443_i0_p1_GENE_NODE_564_length_7515_cov_115_964823_g443_i0NODE_564_length_7515_cov_115_964823_g443_i0_p1_ORF_typecomplete_len554_score61_39_NODE_564_length_7515_cov_115_964823_g443_i024404101